MDTRDHTDEKIKEIRKILLDLSVKLTSKGSRKKFTINMEVDGKYPGKKSYEMVYTVLKVAQALPGGSGAVLELFPARTTVIQNFV